MVKLSNQPHEKDQEPIKIKSWALDLIESLTKISLENIQYYNKELGYYMGMKERTKNGVTKENVNIILHLIRYKIEDNHEDVIKYRNWKKEIIGL